MFNFRGRGDDVTESNFTKYGNKIWNFGSGEPSDLDKEVQKKRERDNDDDLNMEAKRKLHDLICLHEDGLDERLAQVIWTKIMEPFKDVTPNPWDQGKDILPEDKVLFQACGAAVVYIKHMLKKPRGDTTITPDLYDDRKINKDDFFKNPEDDMNVSCADSDGREINHAINVKANHLVHELRGLHDSNMINKMGMALYIRTKRMVTGKEADPLNDDSKENEDNKFIFRECRNASIEFLRALTRPTDNFQIEASLTGDTELRKIKKEDDLETRLANKIKDQSRVLMNKIDYLDSCIARTQKRISNMVARGDIHKRCDK